jgi:hypothetical protein
MGNSPTTQHAVTNNVTVRIIVVPHCHNSTQHVVRAARIICRAHSCDSTSGFLTVWREKSTIDYALRSNVKLFDTVITRCHNAARHVLKLARIIRMAYKCVVVSGLGAVWSHDGIHSTVWCAKEHSMVQICRAGTKVYVATSYTGIMV